jgi:DNA-binding LacI/PurR family transcriptional regulator
MSERKRATIRQVAVEAGVSKQTVSRVLNERPDVARETRKRVERIIHQLGYKPSAVARSLSKGKSFTIGVIGFGLEFFGISRVITEIEAQANSRGYSLALSLIHEPEQNDVGNLLSELVARHMDGIIWAVPHIGDNRNWLVKALEDISVPIVCVSMEPHPDLTVVEVDNFIGGKLVTEHLIEKGYRNIAVITGPANWWASRRRLDGWKATMADAGYDVKPEWIFEGNWSAESGYRGAETLLGKFSDIEAIFAFNDQMALGVQKAANNSGFRIPEDLALVGYDNSPESEFYTVSLTTISQGFTELGKVAMQELERKIKGEKRRKTRAPEAIFIKPKLIVRQSSTPKRHTD